jgi:hypothetical protein
MSERKVFLELHVKVRWRDDESVERLGYKKEKRYNQAENGNSEKEKS